MPRYALHGRQSITGSRNGQTLKTKFRAFNIFLCEPHRRSFELCESIHAKKIEKKSIVINRWCTSCSHTRQDDNCWLYRGSVGFLLLQYTQQCIRVNFFIPPFVSHTSSEGTMHVLFALFDARRQKRTTPKRPSGCFIEELANARSQTNHAIAQRFEVEPRSSNDSRSPTSWQQSEVNPRSGNAVCTGRAD